MYMTHLTLAKSPAAAAPMANFISSAYAEHQVLWQMAGRAQDAGIRNSLCHGVGLRVSDVNVCIFPFTRWL